MDSASQHDDPAPCRDELWRCCVTSGPRSGQLVDIPSRVVEEYLATVAVAPIATTERPPKRFRSRSPDGRRSVESDGETEDHEPGWRRPAQHHRSLCFELRNSRYRMTYEVEDDRRTLYRLDSHSFLYVMDKLSHAAHMCVARGTAKGPLDHYEQDLCRAVQKAVLEALTDLVDRPATTVTCVRLGDPDSRERITPAYAQWLVYSTAFKLNMLRIRQGHEWAERAGKLDERAQPLFSKLMELLESEYRSRHSRLKPGSATRTDGRSDGRPDIRDARLDTLTPMTVRVVLP